MRDGVPIIFFECKMAETDLSKVHMSQLYRYFSATDARFAVLTNGIEYLFFTDLDAPNKMDRKPFLIFDLLDVREQLVEELKRFTKDAFDAEKNEERVPIQSVDEIYQYAERLKETVWFYPEG